MKATVKIRRAEGPSNLCGTWKEFKSIKDANAELSFWSHTYPDMGYDKHDYIVTFENGEEYQGRLDCQHPDNKYYSKQSNNISESAMGFLIYCMESSAHKNGVPDEEAKRYLGYFMESV